MEESGDLSDPDLYTDQLKEVFYSCDTGNRGFLDREQLLLLCSKLQLTDHAQVIVDQLLIRVGGDNVKFENFKESFVSILCGTQVTDEGEYSDLEDENANHNGSQDEGTDSAGEMAPLYIKDGKHYGRRSKPIIDHEVKVQALTTYTAGETTQASTKARNILEEEDHPHSKKSKKDHEKSRQNPAPKDGPTPRDNQQTTLPDSQTSFDSVSSLSEEEIEKEMFEAEGQLNLTLSELEQTQEMNTGEEYLRRIWTTLGVGKQGYITTPELAQVCDHIGMEEMDDKQLQQLFDKLDTDGDGRVSFNEFLGGLFHHTRPVCHTPRSLGTPRALSAQKKVKVGAEERMTPSIVSSTGASGVFSTLDKDQTGFAMPDHIIDLWEKYNVSNGADILLALGFDLNTKVNLAELSSYLEQELINADDQNAVYQAALSSYQQEIRHLKSSAEQFVWETDKLRQDLTEANQRNANLAKEVDERHAYMEQSTQKKLMSVEKKYQEQIKSLHTELEQERELYSSQTTKLKHKLESEIAGLRQEEGKLREKLVQAQKEIDKLESELLDAAERHTDTEKQNNRLQRELQSLEELQSRLDEYETTGVLSPEQQRFTQEKIEKMQTENKNLKDRNDELTAELESIKLQLPSLRKKESPSTSSPREFSSRIPVRDGSLMSEYTKFSKRGARSSLSSENSDDEIFHTSPSPRNRSRRKLPQAPEDEEPCTSPKSPLYRKENEDIENLKKELLDLKSNMERERKEIEHTYKVEISEIEDCHKDEKNQLQESFEKEKMRLKEEHEKTKQNVLSEQQMVLQKEFVHEKQDIIEKYESEKILLQQKLATEKLEYAESLKEEFSQDLQAQIAQIHQDYEREKAELEEYLSRPDEAQYQQILQEKSELEEQLILAREEEQNQIEEVKQATFKEYEAKLEEEKSNFESQILLQTEKLQTELEVERSKFEVQILSLRDQYENEFESKLEEERSGFNLQVLSQREELEAMFNEERAMVEEKLASEIERLCKQHEQEMEDYKKNLSLGLDALEGKTKEDFFSLLNREKQILSQEQGGQLCTALEEEKQKLEKEYEEKTKQKSEKFDKDMEEIVNQYEEQLKTLNEQLDRLNDKLEEEKEEMERRYEEEREALEDELTVSIREEIEEEFVQQIEQLKESFEAEKEVLQQQVHVYQAEVEELQQELDMGDNPRKRADSLSKTVMALQREKKLAEKTQEEMQKTLIQTKEEYQKTVEENERKLQDLEEENEQNLIQWQNDMDKEKMAYNTVLREKLALETLVSELQRKSEKEVNEFSESNKSHYETRIKELEQQVEDYRSKVIPPHAQSVIDSLQQQKEDLSNTLASARNKLDQVDNKVQKLSKQQEQYNHANTENKQLYVKVDLLNHQLGDTVENIQKEKEKMMALQLERDRLAQELNKVNDKLSDTSSKLAAHQIEHSREMESLKDQNSNSVKIEEYTRLKIDLMDHQRQLRDLKDSVYFQDNEKAEQHKAKEEEYRKQIDGLYEEKANLQRKLKLTQSMLEEQLQKIKSHYSDCEKKNVLVVDLYKENADLMEALYVMEERKKDAVSRCYHLEDQCKALRKMLKKVCHVAIS